jgi:SAM-dependent methyltransferase
MSRRVLYVAAEKDPLHLHALRNRFLRTPNVVVQQLDPEKPEGIASMERCFDTVLCVNILEYVNDPAAVLEALRRTLKPNGVIVVLVPQGATLFGTLDRRLGHKRRYAAAEARRAMEEQGLTVEKLYQFNKAGTLPWLMYSRVFSSGRINKPVLKIFDKTVWLWRRIDALLPWRGLSLILVARNAAGPAAPAAPHGPARMQTVPQGLSRQ